METAKWAQEVKMLHFKLLYLIKWVPFKTEITGFSFLVS